MASLRWTSTPCSVLALLAPLAGCPAGDDRGGADGEEFGDGIETIGDDESDTGESDTGESETDESETDTGEDKPPVCESTTAVAQAVPPNVMLVLDKSRSMVLYSWDDDELPATAEVTRWHSLHATVEAVADQYAAGMSLGLTLFPSNLASSAYDQACLVEPNPEVAIGPNTAADLLAVMPGADALDIYGATPAAAGIATARAHLQGLADGRPTAMILVTDGAANCNAEQVGTAKFDVYDDDLPQIVSDAWLIDHIPTYVVGIDIAETSEHPYTEPRVKLDEVAQLGGVARAGEIGFYDARDATALLAALDEIAAEVSCTVELGKPPSGPDDLIISVDGETLTHLDSCDQGDGWIYASADLQTIELCNAACDALLDAGEITAEFSCPPTP